MILAFFLLVHEKNVTYIMVKIKSNSFIFLKNKTKENNNKKPHSFIIICIKRQKCVFFFQNY